MSRRRRSAGRNSGLEQAKRHIAEAKELTVELGGTDEDVKKWFFSLGSAQLEQVLKHYEKSHGAKAAEYARETMPAWRTGKRKMSGLVASRLYDLLPNHMPLKTKFDLVSSLWMHTAPRRKRLVEANPQVKTGRIISAISDEVQSLSTNWTIPEQMKKRFNWLSAGDSEAYQQLLGHIKHQEAALATEVLAKQMPALQERLNNELSDSFKSFKYIINVGQQSVELRLNPAQADIFATDWHPVRTSEKGTEALSVTKSEFPWGWVAFAFVTVLLVVAQS